MTREIVQNDYSEMDRFELRIRRFYYVHHIKCCVTEKMIISFFQRMILDITALKDYRDIKTLQKLSISLDMDKVILLLILFIIFYRLIS